MEIPSVSDFMAQQYGATIDDIDQAGNFTITRQDSEGSWQTQKIDARQLLADKLAKQGIETDPSKIPLTSPDTPVGESKLPFMTQYNLAKSATPKDQYTYLSQELGKDNVRLNKDGEIVVKTEDGLWSKGKTNSALAGLISGEGGAIGGGIIGSQIGAGIGSVLPGVGTLIGGAVGAGIGAVIGKAATISQAYSAGIRTEGDAEDIAKELGKEFLWGVGGELVIGGAIKGLKAVTKSSASFEALHKLTGGNLDDVAEEAAKAGPNPSPGMVNRVKEAVAGDKSREYVSSYFAQMTRTHPEISRFALDNPADFKKHFERAASYLTKGGGAEGAANPVFKEGVDNLDNVLVSAKRRMLSDHGTVLDILGRKLDDIHITPDDLKQTYDPAAMLEADKFTSGSQSRSVLNTLKKNLNIISEIGGQRPSEKAIPLRELTKVSSFINRSLDDKIVSGAGMQDPLVRLLTDTNKRLNGIIQSKLDGSMLELTPLKQTALKRAMGAKEGKLAKMSMNQTEQALNMQREAAFAGTTAPDVFDAGKLYAFANDRYKVRHGLFEELASRSGPEKIEGLYKTLTGDVGGRFRENLSNLLIDVDMDGKGVVKELFARTSGTALAPLMSGTQTASGPIAAAANMAFGPLGTSPRQAGKYLIKLGEQGFMQLKAGAAPAEFVTKLSPKARAAFIKNPAAISAVMKSGVDGQINRISTREALINHGVKAVKGGR